MDGFYSLAYEKKVAFFVGLAKRVVQLINGDKEVKLVEDVLQCCCNQIIKGDYDGDVLYNYLDNEECGITVYAEMCHSKIELAAWDCIIDAVAYMCKYAYFMNNVKYYPEPIELVDDDLVNHILESYSRCFFDDGYPLELYEIISSDSFNNLFYS